VTIDDDEDLAEQHPGQPTRRAWVWAPIEDHPASPPEEADETAADASAPDVLDNAADDRDITASARDVAAQIRDDIDTAAPAVEQLTVDLLLAARDRAAAALDRKEAALDRNRAKRYLKHTYRDALTGVLQRDAGRDQIAREIARARRTMSPLVVAFLDVVGLKLTNDTLGHAAGDDVLRSVGATLMAGLRPYDLIVRWGGDEFVCALPNSTTSDAARRFEQVQAMLSKRANAQFTVGLTELTAEDTLQEVINRADTNLYEQRRLHIRLAAAVPDPISLPDLQATTD
jgi:diguanylate cyclase (GGDEF)-like protein